MIVCNKLFNRINRPEIEIIKLFRPIFIISASILIIFYKFNQIPKNLAFDEVESAKLALSLEGKPYTPYSPQATGHTTLYFYILLLSFNIFGVNNFALRFPAAFFGVINVLIFYFILKKIFRQTPVFSISQPNLRKINYIMEFLNLPFLISLLFLTSRWYFNFARFSFEASFLLFLELVSITFLLEYLNKPNRLLLILSSVFSGLAFNSYLPGRIFFLLPLTLLIIKIINQKNNQIIKQLLLFLIPFLITIAPLSIYLLKNSDIRFEQQFFWKNHELSLNQKINYTWQNVKSIILMFHFKGDVNGKHNYPNKPALNPILGSLFILGFFISLKNYKNLSSLLFVIYFTLSILPSIFTYPWENPNMLRTFTVLPSIFYFIGVALSTLFRLFQLIKWGKFRLILFALIILSSLYEIRTYYKYQAKVFSQAFEIKYDLPNGLKIKKLP